MKENIERRVAEGIQLPEDLYLDGLLDMTSFLFTELVNFLEEENRYLGITKSYIHTVTLTFIKINQSVKEEDIDVYGRILYLYKPLLKREFKRLKSKKLTSGDSVIVIINKILNIIIQDKGQDFKFHKEVKTLKKIITKFFDNIKNRRKEDPLFILSNTIKEYKESGLIGKHSLNSFSFIDDQYVKEELKNPGERMEDSDGKVDEIVF